MGGFNLELVEELRGLFTDPAKLAEFDAAYALVKNDFVAGSIFLQNVECELKNIPINNEANSKNGRWPKYLQTGKWESGGN